MYKPTSLSFLTVLATVQLATAQVRGNYDQDESSGNYKSAKGNYSENNKNNPTFVPLPNVIPNAAYPNMDIVTFNIKGISNQKATDFVAIFSITQMAKTAEEADKLLQIRYDGFVAELQKLGIKKEAVYLDMITFVPIYEYDIEKKIFSRTTYNEVPKGFEVQQNVHIHYTSANLIAKIVSAAAKNEIYDIVKVDYSLLNQEQIKLELQQKCIDALNSKLKEYERIGVKLDTCTRSITEATYATYPNERYVAYSAFSSASIDVERVKVNNTKKVITQFYDKVPYNSFDVVVNPTVAEPEIQFMYDLKITYLLRKPVQPVAAKKEYILLNPQGVTSTLKLD